MPGIEKFIQEKKEFKETYEGLKNESNLISFDGPDGAGKTEISQKVVRKLKENFKRDGKNPDDIVYLKYTKLMDTDSQRNISNSIKKCKGETGAWDKNKIDHILNLWSAKLNRSYNDRILPLIKQGRVVILDRSEIDLFRACMEWGNKELLDKITEYMKNGTLTHGINAGNRVFVYSSPENAYKNLTERHVTPSRNDPRSLQEMFHRVENEKEAEKLILEINKNEKPNMIKVENKHLKNENDRDIQLEKIADNIISKLKF